MKEQILSFFEKIKHLLSEQNEFEFSNCWYEQSYGRNVGGPEAISGKNLFTELSDNHLFPEIDTDFDLVENNQTQLIAAFLKNEKETVDYVYFVIDTACPDFKIIAASRSKSEMDAIIDRKLSLPVSVATIETESPIEITEEERFEHYFNDLNQTLNHHSEVAFAEYWVEKAYYHNLCGEGGLSGKELYTVATDATWQLNPVFELSTFFEKPDAILIHLSIWLKMLEMEKPGEEGLLLLIKVDNKVKILGFGTDLSAMRHLYLKYKEGSVL